SCLDIGQGLTCQLSLVFYCPQVPPPLPGRAAGNCVGQHRHPMLLAGTGAGLDLCLMCTTQKEEADSQTTVSGHRLGEDNARQGPMEDGDNGSADAMENRTILKPENRSAPGIGGGAHIPRLGTGTRARGGVGVVVPTLASAEGSGDLDLVVEVNGGVSILPQGGRPGEAMAGNRSGVRSDDRDDGAPGGVPVEGAMTAGRERDLTTTGAGDEGSGEATIPGQGQEGVMWGTGTGGATLASVSEKMEDVQVDAKGVDEYAYIPDSGSVTVTHGKVGSTSFTQISPDKDDEVNIFIGRANIHVGEQETTQAGVTVGSEDDSILTVGTSSPLQPEGLATAATLSHGDTVTGSPGVGHPTGDDEDGATTIGDGEGLVAPGPWRVTGGDITVPTGAGGGVSIHLGTTVASPGVSEGDCTTALETTGGQKAGKSVVAGRGGSGEVGPATPQPHREGQPRVGARVRPGGAGLDKTFRTDKAPSPHGKASNRASSRAQARAGGHGGNAGVKSHATEAVGSPPPQAGQAGGGMAMGKGQERGQGSKARVAAVGTRGGHLPGHHGRRPGAGAPGAFAALGHSRQVDQVKRADELHIRERAFYALGRAGGGPHGSYTGLGSADSSSQSSEGERGSHSDSRQMGQQPSEWGAPAHPHSRWSRRAL
uniref:Uncharacterized protein n=1 Tax=Strix occidentalis caurina TaxID=311401 RepID=A0A8D0FYH4_STROC